MQAKSSSQPANLSSAHSALILKPLPQYIFSTCVEHFISYPKQFLCNHLNYCMKLKVATCNPKVTSCNFVNMFSVLLTFNLYRWVIQWFLFSLMVQEDSLLCQSHCLEVNVMTIMQQVCTVVVPSGRKWAMRKIKDGTLPPCLLNKLSFSSSKSLFCSKIQCIGEVYRIHVDLQNIGRHST